MDPIARYRSNAPKVVFEAIEGEVIIINLESGNYYSLVDVGTDVWGFIQARATPSDLVAAIVQRYDGDPSDIERDVTQLLRELEQEALIVPVATVDTAVDRPGPSADRGSPTHPVRRPFRAPRLEKYIDLQKLIMLDPILDVDETGWPRTPPKPS